MLVHSEIGNKRTLHIHQQLWLGNLHGVEFIDGDPDHLFELLDQCKAAGIPCNYNYVDWPAGTVQTDPLAQSGFFGCANRNGRSTPACQECRRRSGGFVPHRG